MLLLAVLLATSPNAQDSSCKAATDFNATTTFRRFPSPNLVPWPLQINAKAAYLPLHSNTTTIVVAGDAAAALLPLAHLLAAEVATVTGGALQLVVRAPASAATPASAQESSVVIVLSLNNPQQAWSSVDVSATQVLLGGNTYNGVAAATTTLLQALEHSGDRDATVGRPGRFNCSLATVWRVPHLTVADGGEDTGYIPIFAYRGLMVDAARVYLTLADLKGYVVLCRFYKLNTLYVRCTDRTGVCACVRACVRVSPRERGGGGGGFLG
jgi:hypothetical protein